MPGLDPVAAALRRIFGMQGNHEKRIRNLERATAAIRFNRNNQGGWLYVQSNDSVSLDDFPDPLAVGGDIGIAIEDASGAGMLLGSTTDLHLKSRGSIALEALTTTSFGPIQLGETATFFDSGANRSLEVRGDGTVHIKTGGTIVADL